MPVLAALSVNGLRISMLQLLLIKAENWKLKKYLKQTYPYHVGTHWNALAEFDQMSAMVSVKFKLFSHYFLLTKFSTSSERVIAKDVWIENYPVCSTHHSVLARI